MNSKRIVITGGPGTGKTSIINKLEELGFYCFHEIIRSMTLKAKEEGNPDTFISNPLAFVTDPFEFNKQLLNGRLEQYKKGEEINAESIFYDRATPDVLAYMNHFNQPYGKDFMETCKSHRYDTIFLLPPWEAIYISDNERLESFEEALLIHNRLEKIYTDLGYTVIEVPIGKVSERIQFILEKIK
ncbi:MAG: ATPase [Flavobacteriaceae bacterium]|nr:MAG: ATPase [Flavobacteriaceae bacterium]